MKTLIALIFLITIFSCNNLSDREFILLDAVNESLEISNKNLEASNYIFFKAIEDKTYGTINYEKNNHWYEVAKSLRKECDSLITYLDNLIKNVKPNIVDKESAKKFKLIEKIFLKEKNGDVLSNKILKFENKILSINDELTNEIKYNTIFSTRFFQLNGDSSNSFSNVYFKNQSLIGAITMLNKLINNIRNIESGCFRFCYNNQAIKNYSHEWPRMLVNQNSNVLKIGDELEITTGIATFSSACQPVVTISNKKIVGDVDGVINYKVQLTKAGEFSLPVNLEFTNPDGTKQTQMKIVKYKVVD